MLLIELFSFDQNKDESILKDYIKRIIWILRRGNIFFDSK